MDSLGDSEQTVLLCSCLPLVGKKSKGEWQLFERAMTAGAQQADRPGALRPRVLSGGPTWDDTLTLFPLGHSRRAQVEGPEELWVPLGAGLFRKVSPKIRSLLAKCFPRPGLPRGPASLGGGRPRQKVLCWDLPVAG